MSCQYEVWSGYGTFCGSSEKLRPCESRTCPLLNGFPIKKRFKETAERIREQINAYVFRILEARAKAALKTLHRHTEREIRRRKVQHGT